MRLTIHQSSLYISYSQKTSRASCLQPCQRRGDIGTETPVGMVPPKLPLLLLLLPLLLFLLLLLLLLLPLLLHWLLAGCDNDIIVNICSKTLIYFPPVLSLGLPA